MERMTCDYCGKEFKRKKSQIKLAIKHYCSRSCARAGSKKGKIIECVNCKKTTYKSLKDLERSESKKYFCSRECCNIWLGVKQRGENSPNWTGGKSSYKDLLKRTTVKKACLSCGKDDPRILCVHHVDRNRKNNDLNNLVWLCRNCHFLIHNHKKEMISFMKKHYDRINM